MIFLSAIILFMPYVHVRYNRTDIEGVFGFKWMSSFLFALALPSVLISSGLLIKFLATQLNNEYTVFFRLLSLLIIVSGGFFMAWTFYPMQDDFQATTYYPMLLIFAIGITILSSLTQKAFLYTEEKLIKMIHILFKGYYEDLEEKDLINPWKKDEFKKFRIDLTEKVVKHE